VAAAPAGRHPSYPLRVVDRFRALRRILCRPDLEGLKPAKILVKNFFEKNKKIFKIF
jgi:hypothetical protein